jgi:hypothetical protein
MEKDRANPKVFIKYNLKIKGHTPCPILLLEAIISTINSMVMTRYLMYKNKINNMEDNRFPNISLISNQNYPRLKQGWHKDAKSGLNHF